MKWLSWVMSFVGGFVLASIIYDSGKRSIIRDCHNFHTFTYAQRAYGCMRIRTPAEREQEEAKKTKATEIEA
jgi:hypothetical protein